MRSVGGCASALRRCSAGPRRSPVSARPVIAVWPVSAGYSRCLSLPTISSGCANWWGPRRSHARNPPTHRKSQQNRRKDLLDKQRSATQARVTFDDPTFRFANTEFFSVLLGPGIVRALSQSRRNGRREDGGNGFQVGRHVATRGLPIDRTRIVTSSGRSLLQVPE